MPLKTEFDMLIVYLKYKETSSYNAPAIGITKQLCQTLTPFIFSDLDHWVHCLYALDTAIVINTWPFELSADSFLCLFLPPI